jgi:hypothetical protein
MRVDLHDLPRIQDMAFQLLGNYNTLIFVFNKWR